MRDKNSSMTLLVIILVITALTLVLLLMQMYGKSGSVGQVSAATGSACVAQCLHNSMTNGSSCDLTLSCLNSCGVLPSEYAPDLICGANGQPTGQCIIPMDASSTCQNNPTVCTGANQEACGDQCVPLGTCTKALCNGPCYQFIPS